MRRLALACGSLVLVLILGGCVTQGRYDTLLAERDELAAENDRLRQGAGRLAREGAQLARVVTVLSGELALRETEIAQLEREQKELMSRFDAFVTAGTVKMSLLKDGLHLILSEEILFDSGSTQIHKKGQKVLVDLVTELEQLPYQIAVLGHTDNVPVGPRLADRYPSNWELAAARAGSVVRLMAENGIPKPQLAVVSFGSTRPLADNATPEGRAQNRRIDVRLRPVMADE